MGCVTGHFYQCPDCGGIGPLWRAGGLVRRRLIALLAHDRPDGDLPVLGFM